MRESAPHGSAPRAGIKPNEDGQPTPEPNRKGVYLHSGQIHVSDEPCSITTILGSCVAVCMWDALKGIGGATHYLLPNRVSGHNASVRFGNCAIDQLLAMLLKMGAHRNDLQAKLFGGACIFAGFRSLDEQLGTKNVQLAVRMLDEAAIPVITHDVGGPKGRKLIFNTDSGDAWVKLL